MCEEVEGGVCEESEEGEVRRGMCEVEEVKGGVCEVGEVGGVCEERRVEVEG